MRGRVHAAWLAGAMLLGWGCSGDPAVHDTGYQGTWSRGNDRVVSIVAIQAEGDVYRFRLTKRSSDGNFKTDCDWDGNCVETNQGKKVAEIRYRWWTDAASGHLFTAYEESRFDQENAPSSASQTDELIVRHGGLELLALTRERNGQKYDAPTPSRVLRKVADSVAFPPSGPVRK